MTERQPSIREIRAFMREVEREAEAQSLDPSALETEQVLQRCVARFPSLKTARALEAFEVHVAVGERTSARLDLEMQRTMAIMNFLETNSYANLNEASDDLGFFDVQEVWDYVIDQAKLPPSTAPETIQIG